MSAAKWIVQGRYGQASAFEDVVVAESRGDALRLLGEYLTNLPQGQHRLRVEGEWPPGGYLLGEPRDPSDLYACDVCGCLRVEHAMWVELNAERVVDEFGTWNYQGSSWCPDCAEIGPKQDGHQPIVLLAEFAQRGPKGGAS